MTIGSIYLWNALSDFENHTPTQTINGFFSALEQKDYTAAMKYTGFEADSINTEDDFEKYCNRVYGNDFSSLKMYKTKSDSENSLKYNIYLNEKKVSTFVIKKTGQYSGFGSDVWEMTQAEGMYTNAVEVTAPPNVIVKVGDIELTDEHIISKQDKIDGYETLDDQSLAPKVPLSVTYRLDKLMSIPTITASAHGGATCEVHDDTDGKDDDDDGVETSYYNVSVELNSETKQEYEDLALTAAKAFAQFISEDGTLTNFVQHCIRESNFIRNISSFYAGWIPDHESFGFEDFEFSNMVQYDDTHFSTDLDFTYYVVFRGDRTDYDTKYSMYYTKVDGEWKLASMEMR